MTTVKVAWHFQIAPKSQKKTKGLLSIFFFATVKIQVQGLRWDSLLSWAAGLIAKLAADLLIVFQLLSFFSDWARAVGCAAGCIATGHEQLVSP